MKKQEVISAINTSLRKQLEDYISELNSVNEEIGKETKSSAGDKFETSREMMNKEVSRIEERIAYLKKQVNALNQLAQKTSPTIENGSLVQTNFGLFFFGLAFGKLTISEKLIMGLSLNSPIGKAFNGKNVGDIISFLKRNYKIESIA